MIKKSLSALLFIVCFTAFHSGADIIGPEEDACHDKQEEMCAKLMAKTASVKKPPAVD